MSKVSSYTSWQPLEEVIVGRAYTPDYFDFIENSTVRDQLQQILSETNEDLDNLQRTCETYGAVVRRPDLPDKDQFMKMQTQEQGAPLPPLTPRDWQISLGDKLLRVLPVDELDDICSDYGDQVINTLIINTPRQIKNNLVGDIIQNNLILIVYWLVLVPVVLCVLVLMYFLTTVIILNLNKVNGYRIIV